jgi:hypothetical protein
MAEQRSGGAGTKQKISSSTRHFERLLFPQSVHASNEPWRWHKGEAPEIESER